MSVAALVLTGSLGSSQQEVADPSRRLAAVLEGDYSPVAFARLTSGMDPAIARLADGFLPGRPPWQPPPPVGWTVIDFEKPPSLFAGDVTFDEARLLNSLVPDSPLPIAPMKPFLLPGAGAEHERAMLCLTQAVYYEAGFESGEGQEAVAQVVLNRLRHPAYPKSVCGVVYEGSQRATGCQFSFTCDGSLKRPISTPAWDRSRFVAAQALRGFVYAPVGASTHYHADYVFPFWAPTLVKLRQIGAHIFYRMTGPGGAPAAFTGRYAGGELSLPASVLTGGDTRTPDAPTSLAAPAKPSTNTITLHIGGETRSYTVAAPPEAGAPPPGLGNPMILQPTRRAPTPDEIKMINERMKTIEEQKRKSLQDAINAGGAPLPDRPTLRVEPAP